MKTILIRLGAHARPLVMNKRVLVALQIIAVAVTAGSVIEPEAIEAIVSVVLALVGL